MQYVISLAMASCLFVSSIIETFDNRIISHVNVSDVKINYKIKGKDVYIECIIPNFSFQKEKSQGNVHVYLNDKKYKEVNQAAFILKDLPNGNHKITLKFVGDNGGFRYSKSFHVHIQ